MTSTRFHALFSLSLFRSASSNVFEGAKWLHELHKKLWGREELLDQVFRAVDLTEKDFVELQSELHNLNPSRNHARYLSTKENILDAKIDFLRSRTATRPLIINTDSLVPKVVLCDHVPAGTMDVDPDHEGAKNDEEANSGEDDNTDEDYNGGNEYDKSYIEKDAAVLLQASPPVLPCSIRFMDLICLNLQHLMRVPKVLLIRDEWDTAIDIFNQGLKGIRGSAVWAGQPGTGK